MLLFGHIGLTSGVFKACAILTSRTKPANRYQSDSHPGLSVVISRKQLRLHYWRNRIKRLIGSVDYRLVILGSLLPDIIDKPVWLIAHSYTALSGRDYAHTLLFNLVLLVAGLLLLRRQKSWLLIVSLSNSMHLVFDQIWNSPLTLWWPLLGPLSVLETTDWLSNMIGELFGQPQVYLPEIAGLVIISLFAYRLMLRKSIISFLKGGAIE